MVKIRKMTQFEYDVFQRMSIEDYAKDLFKSGYSHKDEAIMDAQDEFNEILSDGLYSPLNYLFTILNEENIQLGYIWYLNEDGVAFLCDFLIYDQYRRKGYGTKAISLIEKHAKENGFKKIMLNVFKHNKAGMNLYKKLNYTLSNDDDESKILTKNL